MLKKIPVDTIEDANDAHEEARRLQGLKHSNIVRYNDDFLHTEYGHQHSFHSGYADE